LDEKTARSHYEQEVSRSEVSPNPYFDESFYIVRYPDVMASIKSGEFHSGFDHYCKIGHKNREPHWLFNEQFYRSLYPDIDDANLKKNGLKNGYHHFLIRGQFENRLGSLFFNPNFYIAHWGETTDPFGHFLRHGQHSGLRSSLYFDEMWYRATYPTVMQAIKSGIKRSGLHHYLTNDEPTNFDPSPDFNENYYLATNPSLGHDIESGLLRNCYEHYLRFGRFEGRRPTSWFDPDLYGKREDVQQALLSGKHPTVFDCYLEFHKDENSRGGHVDSYGYHSLSGGWFFYGWVEWPWSEQERPMITARFANEEIRDQGKVSFFPREDLAGQGVGLVFFLRSSNPLVGKLISVEIDCHEATLTCSGQSAQQLRDGELAARLQTVLSVPGADAARALILGLLSLRGYTGVDTLSDLKPRVILEIDETIFCPPAGLLLIGWLLTRPDSMEAIQVHSGPLSSPLRMADCIRIARPDVIEGVGSKYGFGDAECGFIGYAAEAFSPGDLSFIEVKTELGEIGCRGLPAPIRCGLPAIKHVLSLFEVTFAEVVPAFTNVIAPSLASLNAARLTTPLACSVINFGALRATPRISVIIPLFGRIDYLEYQLAIFAHDDREEIEYIYVLDDPPQRRLAEHLAESIFCRFGLAFRLVMSERNLGFGPASNLGLSFARGRYVCFLNSDVFPGTPEWAERLADNLEADATLGVVGPQLLFEDGTVQHEGMSYEAPPSLGNLLFPIHPRKGLWPDGSVGLKECAAITGACMMLSRDLAMTLGGFDLAYIIGDFEDSDLCQKIYDRGLRCFVDQGVRLYHLERRSQAMPDKRWRRNLTLYNAWVHEQRWGAILRARGMVTVGAESDILFSASGTLTPRPALLRPSNPVPTTPMSEKGS
jgi:GT2 family glycosyltransferase